ncbi:uncharacterized protein LOC142180095 [Nicotiana tabacum]|uniref:Uncharacterized protein LOC142180095 n=1 Tax=Nicotiana tabacum TaxID=4097 RepID=A0AC58UCD1_TOBAC
MVDNQQLHIAFRNLERQFGEQENNQNTRPAGALSCNIEKNPQVNAVMLRNGRELVEVPKKKKSLSGLEDERPRVEIPFQRGGEAQEMVAKDPIGFQHEFGDIYSCWMGYDMELPKRIAKLEPLHERIQGDDFSGCHLLVRVFFFLQGQNSRMNFLQEEGLDSRPSRYQEMQLSKPEKEEKLLRVLREHKRAIGWTMSDIKDISPAFCMHKILMEEGHKPSMEHQCRLNPIMKEVVRKDVIKWLDVGVVFPISDNKWVNPAQCVPKNGGMTVVVNEQNELIPTRVVTGWKICIVYMKLNNATRKDHFPLPFIDQMLDRYNETNLLLNREKCYFMVREGIVLGHKVSKDGLEVNKAKVEAIGKFLEMDVPFKLDDACLKAFEELKKKLVSAPIIVAPNWNGPFELMCDTSDGAIRTVLGQRTIKVFHSIYYERMTVTPAQINYTVIEKELLTIRDRKGTESQGADHLSRLETRNHVDEGDIIKETFLDEQLLGVTSGEMTQYADFMNYLASGEMSPDLEPHAKRKFLQDVRPYMWDEPFLFKSCSDQLMRRCVPESKINDISHDYNASLCGGHHSSDKMATKVLQSGFYCPRFFKDNHELVRK